MKIQFWARWTMLAAGLLAFPACQEKKFLGACENNADCGEGWRCGTDNQCLCLVDTVCGENEYCNAEGYCQKHQGCLQDADCGDPDEFSCNTSSGRGVCLCRSDQACEDDEICNTEGACQKKAGCIIDADCGEANHWRCWINPQNDIGECLCELDLACESTEFCNLHGYCQQVVDDCLSDQDCPDAGTFCNTEIGECLCDSDDGCDSDEICNASGYCQPRPGCYDNRDCAHLQDHYCDLLTRTCVPVGVCNDDRQCPLGAVCRQNACIDGCNDSADCPLDQRCLNYQCQPGCQSDEFCAIGELCDDGQCHVPANNPYCDPCDSAANECNDANTWCLVYPFIDDGFTSDSYCTADCDNSDRCPNGFVCNDIIVIFGTCRTDEDCVDGLGFPLGVPCIMGAESDVGYCPCHPTDLPCPANICTGFFVKRCFMSGKPCSSDADCRQNVTCEESVSGTGYGGCQIGRACGLEEGVHCD